MPRMSARPSSGMPAAVRTMANVTMPAPGTPAAPTLAAVAVATMAT